MNNGLLFRLSRRRWIICWLLLSAFAVCAPACAQYLSVLAERPDWNELEPFQQTITRADFLRLLETVYAPGGAWKGCIDVQKEEAIIHPRGSGKPLFRLRFAPDAASAKPIPRYWTPAGTRPALADKPLTGTTIALDPGHLGGRWAKMEERWFQIGGSQPVMEGEIALAVARHLADRLTAMGAKVVFVRKSSDPVTMERPRTLRSIARAELQREGVSKIREDFDGPNDPMKSTSVRWESELLFYRVSEIRSRAELVNRKLRPDLVICLHLNAEEWGDPAHPSLTDKNHLHLLVNGNCGPGELAFDDIRHAMLFKLLSRSAREEIPLSNRVASSLATATGLPPFEYFNGKARRVSESPYVWSRNLLATRLYRCPVVYCEPYVMNSKPVFDRLQLGDYDGLKPLNGTPVKSLYREYADAVADGVGAYFASKPKGI